MGNQESALCDSDSLSLAVCSNPRFDNLSIIDCTSCTRSHPETGTANISGKTGIDFTKVIRAPQQQRRGLTAQGQMSLSSRVPEIHVGVEEGFKRAKSSGAVVRIGSKDLTASKHDMVPIRRNDATLLND